MNAQTRIVAASTAVRFTTREFLHMVEAGAFDDMKVELIDGELERMAPPMGAHSSRQALIIALLWPIVGRCTTGETGIDLGGNSVVGCDTAVLRAPMNEHRLLRPEEVLLAIEVAETTIDRDLGMKRIRYAAAGIPHYWVVDGERSVVHVYGEPVDGDYKEVAVVRFGEPLAVPGTDATIIVE